MSAIIGYLLIDAASREVNDRVLTKAFASRECEVVNGYGDHGTPKRVAELREITKCLWTYNQEKSGYVTTCGQSSRETAKILLDAAHCLYCGQSVEVKS